MLGGGVEIAWRFDGAWAAATQVDFDCRVRNVSRTRLVEDVMPKKPEKRDAAKRATAKSKGAKKKSAAKSPGAKAPSTTAQLDAESDYFHRTLRENAQLSPDIVLGPGETHTSTPDSRGQPSISRKRFSAR
jgi:hypothetical protein